MIDLQYTDVREDKTVQPAGGAGRSSGPRRVGSAAGREPPADTRAYFRGRCLAKYSDSVAAASWDSVIFDIPGYDSLQRVPTMEPQRGTREHVGELLDRCETAADLVAALTGKR